MRYTSKAYQQELAGINKGLAFNCSINYPVYGGRNGYTYADHYRIDSDGQINNVRMLDGGTPKEAIQGAYSLDTPEEKKLTRKQCKAIAHIAGLDFELDFHQLHSSFVDLLVTMAKKSNYRRPSGANGSTGRYFFNHLKNKVDIGNTSFYKFN